MKLHVKIARAEDLQQFRFPINLLTVDSKNKIELYHLKIGIVAYHH